MTLESCYYIQSCGRMLVVDIQTRGFFLLDGRQVYFGKF